LVQLAETIIFIRRSARKNREARQGEPVLAEGQNAPRNKKTEKKTSKRRGCFFLCGWLKKRIDKK
jgi:hypothetical protein